jgi:hypothetical protein
MNVSTGWVKAVNTDSVVNWQRSCVLDFDLSRTSMLVAHQKRYPLHS